MNNDTDTRPNSDETIRPASVTLNVTPNRDQTQSGNRARRQSLLLWTGFGIAGVALLAVVFVLPTYITQRPTAPTAAAPSLSASAESPKPTVKAPQEAPWTDAQFARQRREAQDVLAKLLTRQEQLEALAVEQWASEEYAAAQANAAEADALYKQQAFEQAQSQYQKALAEFDALLKLSDTRKHEEIARGEAALLAGDSALAKASFELALLIDPNQVDAQAGLARAKVLDDVLDKVKAGKQRERDNDFDAAKAEYLAALKLDGKSQIAQTQLTGVEQAIKDRDFAKQMSLGFAALNSEEHDKAIHAFQRALAIKPGAGDAQDALTQARNQSTQSALGGAISEAKAAEADARWHDAVADYQRALALDKNLVEARVGLIRSKTRADIHDKLEAILATPERLTADAVHQEFRNFYAEMRALQNPDPKLEAQLDQLAIELERAVSPVTVQFVSDNQTKVVLYKIGELGQFDQKALNLAPGQYTAVGTRDGYRDVRRDFRVSANQPETVTIQCDEKISKG